MSQNFASFSSFIVCLVALIGLSDVGSNEAASADLPASSPRGEEFFEAKIRPTLVQHCYQCHSVGGKKSEGGLFLDSREGIRRGGLRGPAVVPGKPADSWLLTAVSHTDTDLKMPPKKERFPQEIISNFRAWIEMGAPDPRDSTSARPGNRMDMAAGQKFWSFQKPQPQFPPVTQDADWAAQKLDRFVLAKLEKAGLKPSPDATSASFLRRLYFDLLGLPPTPDAIRNFEQSVIRVGYEIAIAAEVDSLLARPQYGELWGRHWLDVTRFAESSGKEANMTFPYAWRYRDYVIDAMSEDVPFNQFVAEQVAGDLLPFKNDRERARLLIATGFLALGPKNLDEAEPRQFTADLIDEQVDAVTRAVLASSVACARCHDHKFDPFSMRDYYALAGVFGSTKTYFGTYVTPVNRVGGDPLRLPAGANVPILHAGLSPAHVANLKRELASLRKQQQDGMAAVARAQTNGTDSEEVFSLRDALRIFWTTGSIEGQLEKVDEEGKPLPLAMGVLDAERIGDSPLLERGDVNQCGNVVPRALPQVFAISKSHHIGAKQSGRLELAYWLTDPDQPLTSRVIVNRVWRHLFEAGLVNTVDNFGFTGAPPSHPELLDDLAVQFVADGWSIKRLIRTIVLSRTYRQSSSFRAEAFQKDPDNRLLWRANKRRLPAEAIRDSMLFATGEIALHRPVGSLVGKEIGDGPVALLRLNPKLPRDLDGSRHRSVYLPVLRNRLPDVLELFDFAEPSLVTGDRETTNVPSQALYLMNSPFVLARADAMAARLIKEFATLEDQATRAYEICLGRAPDREEVKFITAFLASGRDNRGDEQHKHLLAAFCQALFAIAEFRNID